MKKENFSQTYFSTSQAAAFAATWSSVELELAQAFGTATSTRTRKSGATPDADATTGTVSLAGSIIRAKLDALVSIRAGASVSDAPWWYVGAADADLETHDEIATSDGRHWIVGGTPAVVEGLLLAEVQPL